MRTYKVPYRLNFPLDPLGEVLNDDEDKREYLGPTTTPKSCVSVDLKESAWCYFTHRIFFCPHFVLL